MSISDSNPTPASAARISSVDLLRGIVMVLMAIDHIRVYSGIPAGGPDYGVFFTRWITNFCAPGFAFLAGTGIFLFANRGRTRAELIRYLLIRGLFLVLLELTVVRFSWTFNLDYSKFTLAGILWMLGWCMVGMAVLTAVPPAVTGVIGIAIVSFQSVFGQIPGLLPVSWQKPVGYFWEFVYPSGFDWPPGVLILYVVVPWIGVMAMGYGIGPLFRLDRGRRRRIFLAIGLAAIALYVIIGCFQTMRHGTAGTRLPFLLRLLNQRKYPASPLFVLMTLGPLVALLPWAETGMGRLARLLKTFGRVPLFFYLLHIPIIHISCMIVNYFRMGTFGGQWYGTAPDVFVPPDHRWPLWLLYLEWVGVVVILYYLCRWYAMYKNAHPDKRWLSFL